MIEFHGYHSKSWIAPLVTFPSQHFGFRLVRQAMDRGALIVLGQAMRYWYAAVPGLHDYENKIERVASSRLVNLSVLNPRTGFLEDCYGFPKYLLGEPPTRTIQPRVGKESGRNIRGWISPKDTDVQGTSTGSPTPCVVTNENGAIPRGTAESDRGTVLSM